MDNMMQGGLTILQRTLTTLRTFVMDCGYSSSGDLKDTRFSIMKRNDRRALAKLLSTIDVSTGSKSMDRDRVDVDEDEKEDDLHTLNSTW